MPKTSSFPKAGVVYALVDPASHKVMYVGQTVRTVEDRIIEHLSKTSLVEASPKNEWLKSLLDNGLKPLFIILEEASGWDLVDAENKWIEAFRVKSKGLTNRSPIKTSPYKYPVRPQRIQKLPTVKMSERRLLQLQREKDAVKSCLAK